ncbi:MAG TPA: MBL fold metallo-hydrolase [Mycobacteriales bacterium]|nr:MBL fold metallo-hydrolase [Mycobacteriales bacterium]
MSEHETLHRDGLTVTVVDTPSLGDRSYVVDDGSRALVVDPQRDVDRVERVLAERGVRLAAVAETHAHNDYVTGGLELARTHGVPYLVPCEAEVDYERTAVCGEDVRQVGRMTVRAIDTPGHTPHHLAFAVGVGDRPAVVFTGGSMLFGAVGRTDLVSADLTVDLTHRQFHSVRRLVDELPGDVAVLPTHGFGSFCSATPTTGTSSSVDQQRAENPALTQDEERFVAELLAGLDAYPAYYAHMGGINLAGPEPVDLSPVAEADADELRRRLAAGEWVVDLRDRTAFARGHVPDRSKL